MAAGDGAAGKRGDDLSSPEFVGWIAYAEVTGNGIGFGGAEALLHLAAELVYVELGYFFAPIVVAPAQIHDVFCGKLPVEPILAHQVFVIANEEERYGARVAFGEGVGGEGGGDGDERDVGGRDRGAMLAVCGQRGGQRRADALCQIVARG